MNEKRKKATAPPKYRAYKPVKMTDGLQTRIDHRFDMTQPLTEDDLAAFRATLDAAAPSARVAEMRTHLDAIVSNTSPAIRLHVDGIRSLYDRLSIQATTANDSAAAWA